MTAHVLPFPSAFPLRHVERDGVRIQLIGNLHGVAGDPLEVIRSAVVAGGVFRDIAALRDGLRALHGNFALVVKDGHGAVLAACDKIKSYPIFYRNDHGALRIAGDAESLRTDRDTRNSDAFLEFAMAGFVTNGETLFEEICALRGGEFFLYDHHGRARVHEYYRFHDPEARPTSRHELIDELHDVTVDIFQRLIQRLDGRTALIPLSGGYDSRLVITMLKRLKYDAIRTFSYGIPGNCEAAAARVVAERLGVPWVFMPYTRALGRAMYQTDERIRYFAFVHQLSATPTMTDFYALCDLARRNALPRDAVIINGQTGDFISGGHAPTVCANPTVERGALVSAILAKHYSLWLHLRTPANDARMRERIGEAMADTMTDSMESDMAMKCYEFWEWRARQCEHVVVGQRAYDFFGLAWELPLWDDLYLNFWSRIPYVFKARQSLYLDALRTHDVFGVFQLPFRRYTPPLAVHVLSEAFRIFGHAGDALRRQYLRYWQKYAYFYAIYPYREYIRTARHHRNPVSFLARDILAEYQGERGVR